MAIKKSKFVANTVIPAGSEMDFFVNGTNFRMSVETLYAAVEAFINPLSLIINDISESSYVVSDADTGTFLVFNDAATVDVSIPDSLSRGVNFAYTNKGAGSVQLVFTGADTLRGTALVADADGYAAVTKIGFSIWQTSER